MQIIEYYGARRKVESGFKEIKQDIGSSKSQARNAYAVMNYMNFSTMAATITWIYGARLENILDVVTKSEVATVSPSLISDISLPRLP